MNYPGNPSGNWAWRMGGDTLDEALCGKIRELNDLYSREKTKSPQSE
jgi:4-alpha-glucanotransferase